MTLSPALIVVLLPLILIAGVFGWNGWRRGWMLEAITTGGIVLSWLLVNWGGGQIVRFANQMWLGIQLVLRGGIDSPNVTQIVADLRQRPLVPAGGEGIFLTVFFGFLLVLSYVIPTFYTANAGRGLLRIPGFLVGMLNGVLVLFFFLQATQFTVTINDMSFSTAAFTNTIQGYLLPLLVVVLLVVIASIFLRGLRPTAPAGGGGGGGPRR